MGTFHWLRRISTQLVSYAALGVVAACSAPAASTLIVLRPSAEPSGALPSPPAAEPTASVADTPRPIPARVADLHRTIFEASAKPVPGGKVQCLITIHDGQLSHDPFYVVVLFAGGSVATWAQSPKGPVVLFFAKLTPEEDARALGWLEQLTREPGAAHDRFSPSTTVMGISTRPGQRVDTSYFALDETPPPLDALAWLLKHRLEATNAP